MKKTIILYLICIFGISAYVGFISTFELDDVRVYLEEQSFLAYDDYINSDGEQIYKEMYSRECYVGVRGYLNE